MNPRLQKINAEIDKLRRKVNNYQNRLRVLEQQKTELENAEIIALVRGVDMPPEDFAEFIRAFRERQGRVVPDVDADANADAETGAIMRARAPITSETGEQPEEQ